jgi:mRNA interferase RelE/StbE
MSYEVILPKTVQKELDRLPTDISDRVLDRLAALETNPRPADVKKLKGRSAWRIRIGDYRAIYEINDRSRQIIVVTVAHRRNVYR